MFSRNAGRLYYCLPISNYKELFYDKDKSLIKHNTSIIISNLLKKHVVLKHTHFQQAILNISNSIKENIDNYQYMWKYKYKYKIYWSKTLFKKQDYSILVLRLQKLDTVLEPEQAMRKKIVFKSGMIMYPYMISLL